MFVRIPVGMKLRVTGWCTVRRVFLVAREEDRWEEVARARDGGKYVNARSVQVGPFVFETFKTYNAFEGNCDAVGPEHEDGGGAPFCVRDEGHVGNHRGYNGETWTDEETTGTV